MKLAHLPSDELHAASAHVAYDCELPGYKPESVFYLDNVTERFSHGCFLVSIGFETDVLLLRFLLVAARARRRFVRH